MNAQRQPRQKSSLRVTNPLLITAQRDASSSVGRGRLAGIDALRGLALCLMIIYHFSFDLTTFNVTATDFNHDPFWLSFRALIVTSFLLLVGVSLVLAQGASGATFWRRLALIGACAALVSLGSYLMFPSTFIYFGILHCIALSSFLARPFRARPQVAMILGILVIAVGLTFSSPFFDARPWHWIGLMTLKPATEDYVPLFPWFGVVLVGIWLADICKRDDFAALRPIGRFAPAWLTFLGRHSLLVYMVHQPLLLALLWLALGR